MKKSSSFVSYRSVHLVHEPRILIGIIADEETTVGFLLAGIGELDTEKKTLKNFYIVKEGTPLKDIENGFTELYNQKHIGVILIGEDIYKKLSAPISKANKLLPIIVAVPTKASVVEYLKHKSTPEIED